jgi:hypothetical protein
MYTITIDTWVNGTPTTVRTITDFLTKEDGMIALRNIGHSWQYDINHVVHLWRGTQEAGLIEVGRLNIFHHTYRVDDMEAQS